MSLRKKTFLTILITFAGLVMILYGASRALVLDSYTKFERLHVQEDVRQIQSLIRHINERMGLIAADWAQSDDTCAFADGLRPDFIKTSLSGNTLSRLKISLILFLKPDGSVLYSQMRDPQTSAPQPVPREVLDALRAGGPSLPGAPKNRRAPTGFVRFPAGFMIVATRPIVKTNGSGPSHGTVAVGYVLGPDFFSSSNRMAGSRVNLLPAAAIPALPGAPATPLATDLGSSVTIAQADHRSIVGMILLNDFSGRPLAELRIEHPRTIYQSGEALVAWFILLILASGLVFSIILAVLFKKIFLNRIARLDAELERVGARGDLTARIDLPGHDEFSHLAAAVNGMLEQLMKSQEALRQSEERMRLSLAGSQVGIWDWNIPAGSVAFCNDFMEILGYSRDENAGAVMDHYAIADLDAIAHPKDLEQSRQAVLEHFAGHTPSFECELRLRAKSGEWLWFLARGQLASRDAAGDPLRAVGLLLDVTDRRNAQAALIKAHDTLEARVSARTVELARAISALTNEVAERQRVEAALCEADRRKDEFLAMLAHELRNPLAPIRNAVRVLHMAGEDEQMKHRQWEVIDRQVSHMARLLDDLLDVSRIRQGKIRLITETLDLRQVLDTSLEVVQSQANEHGHTLLYRRPSAPLWITGDPTRLEQVFTNLLNNAIKYTEGRGTIQLHVGREATLDPEVRHVVIRIRDTGIGIAPEVLPHIFGLFVQGDRSLDRTQGGLGIGLTLVDRLAQMHGGSVQASSEGLGQGSEFVVRLPLLPEALTASLELPEDGQLPLEFEPEPVALEPGIVERRILVVDDNADQARSMCELLELWGYQVRVAFDGASAIEVATIFEPEIVLLDIGLPGMNGYEVARSMRKVPAFSATLLVALTGYSQEEDRQTALDAGFNSFCTKPVDLDELRRILQGTSVGDLDRTV